jgi:hypothetical protein
MLCRKVDSLSRSFFLCKSLTFFWEQEMKRIDQALSTPSFVSMNRMPKLWSIPGELHLLIFRFLSPREFRICRAVCVAWKLYFFENVEVVSRVYQLWFQNEAVVLIDNVLPGFLLEARTTGQLLKGGRKPLKRDRVAACLRMRDELYVNHNLKKPAELSKNEREWLEFVCSNVVLQDVANKVSLTEKKSCFFFENAEKRWESLLDENCMSLEKESIFVASFPDISVR